MVESIYGDLPTGWSIVSIADLIKQEQADLQTGPFGTMLHASAYKPNGTPVVAVKNIANNRLDHTDIPCIDATTVNRLSRYQLITGDILFGRKGAVERRALVRMNETGWVQGSDCIRLRFLTPDIDSLFVSYVLGSPQYRSWIIRNAHGATMPSLNQDILGRIPLPLPPLPEQRAIARILGSLDDRIELNRRMNATLEAMAQATFKSWFVDFDPVRAKMEGREPAGMDAETAALFPDGFEVVDGREVPVGWRVVPLPEAIEINPRISLRKGDSAPYLDMKNMPRQGHRAIEWVERPFGSGVKFENGDTLLARITPCLENGKTAYVDFLNDGQVGWGSTEYIVLRPKPPLPKEYGYYLARSETFRTYTIQNMSGTSGRQRAAASCFDNYPVVVPSSAVAKQFEKIVKSIMLLIKQKDEESRTLTALRDTLLPRLISGEIRVPVTAEQSEDRASA